MSKSACRLVVSWVVLLGGLSVAVHAEQPALQYNRDVRGILADNCFTCHGPDSAARKGDLRLDLRDAATEAGAIVPSQPDDSTLVQRIFSSDPEEVMPPPTSRKQLTAEQKETLRRWIAEGAQYQAHWSFLPPTRPAAPAVRDAAWVRNPIDAFVLARLEAAGLQPSPATDRAALARRASLDITGLPPAPEQVAAFLNDPSDDAYEKYLDQLFRSEHWGEHRGRYWLDYARYADTHGVHFDNYREMWSYRDWVIQAFHQNMPFDQFTIESLAGDLLPNRTTDQWIGSGFHRCNMTTNEGGIIDEEYAVLYARDRTETTAQVWLGITANCSTCHDHKFDPLTQREFYQLSAFFNNTTQRVRDGNIKDTPPIVPVILPADRQRHQELGTAIPALRERLAERKRDGGADFDQWAATVDVAALLAQTPTEGLHVYSALHDGTGQATAMRVDGQDQSVPLAASAAWINPDDRTAIEVSQGAVWELPAAGDFEGDQPFSCAAWIRLPANDSSGAIVSRMDDRDNFRGWDFWLEGRKIGMHLINRWSNNAIKVVSEQQAPANRWVHVAFSYDGSRKAAGVSVYIDGELQKTGVQADSLSGTTRTSVPLKLGQRHTSSPLSGVAIHDLRVYRRSLPAADVAVLARSAQFVNILTALQAQVRGTAGAQPVAPAQRTQLYEWWLASFDPPSQQFTGELAKLESELAQINARGTIAHVMQERDEPAMAYVLFRGDYDKRRDQVAPATPAFLPPFPTDAPANRLGLAKWLLLPEHPLTARVTVNRFWQEVFGTGIVRTAGDFGAMGELPSHPELLDWLAVEFRESGWDVKRLFKLMLTSATYRQATNVSPERLAADPENRLLSRGPRFRLDAEMVRDTALAASGLLVRRIGGPSVKPYQPEGVWEAIAMTVSNTRSYERGAGDDLYRRSLYTFWKRQAPPASLEIFNAPNREFCVVRRERTNTPLQALVTLNDEQFVECARQLAQRAMQTAGSDPVQRLQFIAARVVARPFRAEELSIIQSSLDTLLAHYRAHANDAQALLAVGASPPDPALDRAELAAWTMLCNELLNLDEALNK